MVSLLIRVDEKLILEYKQTNKLKKKQQTNKQTVGHTKLFKSDNYLRMLQTQPIETGKFLIHLYAVNLNQRINSVPQGIPLSPLRVRVIWINCSKQGQYSVFIDRMFIVRTATGTMTSDLRSHPIDLQLSDRYRQTFCDKVESVSVFGT